MHNRLLVRALAYVLLHALRGLRYLRTVVSALLECVGHLIAHLRVGVTDDVHHSMEMRSTGDLSSYKICTTAPAEDALELLQVLIASDTDCIRGRHGSYTNGKEKKKERGRLISSLPLTPLRP